MERQKAIERIAQLRDTLWECNRRYYVDNAPSVSDYEYDMMMNELIALEKEHPDLVTPDSPTQKVGSDLESEAAAARQARSESGENAEWGAGREFRQVRHKHPMLSLGNTYSISEVEEFAQRAAKTIGGEFTYSCELKFDGTAICLTYRDGKLYQALTRGDGLVGDDVTANARMISNIPHVLKGKGWPSEFEIRGEVLMPYASFDALNRERELDEDPPFANPRNAASGSLKLLDSAEVGRRGLMCTLYHIPDDSIHFPTHSEALDAAASWGLPVSDKRKIAHGIDEIEQYISYWDTERKNLPYATDGIVIKINETPLQKALGFTSKFPRWAVAYKFKAEDALTRLVSIDYQVGRTGAVTPVANLEPVLLSGTMVKRATLNNADQMALLDIRVGDYVHVEKGGEIIPKITSVELSMRPQGTVSPVFPATCPDCGTPLVKEEDQARYFCPNEDGCPTQIKGKIIHFLSRKAMNIIAGEATVDQLYSLGLAKTPSDLYSLRKMDLVRLDGWKDRAAQRFLDSLQQSKGVPFERVLFALGIRYVGETTAKTLARHFENIDALAQASLEELKAVPDVGDVVAESVYSFFRTPSHVQEVEKLREAGLNFTIETRSAASQSLAGKTIVISGNFSISREEMKRLIEDNGGKNSSSVSSKTTYLLAGSKPGPEKMKKASELGVQTIDEDTFFSLIGRSSTGGRDSEDEEPNLFPGMM